MTAHAPTIQSSAKYGAARVHRFACECGASSPWTHSRPTAQLAYDDHVRVHGLEPVVVEV